MICENDEDVIVTLSSSEESDAELDYIPLKKRHKGNGAIEECNDELSLDEESDDMEGGVMKSNVEACLQEISEVKSVLQIIIDQVSQQQTAVEQLISRVSSLEQAHKKQKIILNHCADQTHKNGVKRRPKKRLKSQKFDKGTQHLSNSADVDCGILDLPSTDQKTRPISTSDSSHSICLKKNERKLKTIQKIKVKKPSAKHVTSTEPARSIGEGQVQSSGSAESKEPTDSQISDNAAIPYPIKEKNAALSALEINHTSLLSINEVLCKYESFVIRGCVGALCRKLASEAIFGDDVLMRCTPKGVSSLPALPIEPFNLLKSTVFKTFPDQWSTPSDFEKVWVKCVAGIENLCYTLRKKAKQGKEQSSSVSTASIGKSPAVKEIVDVRNALSSIDIPKSELMSISDFLELHSTAINEGRFDFGFLTRRLAIDVIFGEKILSQCTPLGWSTYPGLPVAELNLLKQTVLDCNPAYWECMEDFEKKWTKVCMRSLTDFCWKLRTRASKQ